MTRVSQCPVGVKPEDLDPFNVYRIVFRPECLTMELDFPEALTFDHLREVLRPLMAEVDGHEEGNDTIVNLLCPMANYTQCKIEIAGQEWGSVLSIAGQVLKVVDPHRTFDETLTAEEMDALPVEKHWPYVFE
jgi:hypothetical protein